ncbi:MAG: dipeptidase [Bacteroidota bacterium]
MKKLFVYITVLFSAYAITDACTNLLVTKGASTDGSTMIFYSADAGGFMEPLYFLPAQKHEKGDSIEIYDWDTGKYLGKIPQVEETYQVVGNMNEFQVSIGETTFTGRKELRDTTGIIDYGSLMRLALQRAKTAREAIDVIDNLLQTYGYYSTGESFSIADPNEVWYMEMIGKGPGNTGAVWVARKVPDGYISAHANQARITTFPTNDPENTLYTEDVIDLAVEKGYYDPDSGEPFSFADTYNPLDPTGLLYCEGRVWSLFRRSAPSLNLSPDYFRAVVGAEPYPLWIKPDERISLEFAMSLVRDHFEGTDFDMRKGLAAAPFGNPYRWKNLGWEIEGDTTKYGWERPISTQQTAFSFISQMRSWLPDEIGGVFWYGTDDNYSTVYVPLYCSIEYPPKSFTVGAINDFTMESAFWVFNLVANLAYTKYDYMIKDIQKVQSHFEGKFMAFQPAVDKAALSLYETDKKLAVNYLTDYSVSQAEMVVERWRELWRYLVMKYNDGFVNDVNVKGGRAPKGVGYGEEFFKKVIEERPGYHDVEYRYKDSSKK